MNDVLSWNEVLFNTHLNFWVTYGALYALFVLLTGAL